MAEDSTTPQQTVPATTDGAASGDAVNNAGQSFSALFTRIMQNRDLFMPLVLMLIVVVMILPIPTWLLDISLALSITFSVLILMTVMSIDKPLELSAFPTILLVATTLRLSLNIASTRLILSNGHEGTSAAGKVIEAFGGFIMGNNYVIGIIVFSILVIINFIVITKGSGRIAEVAARFSLDAMPGKQMAIDADLSSGLINEQEAKERRKELEEESSFYGAMDGAAKFVRGDAIAAILITLINIIAGIIIGVAQRDLTFGQAAEYYTSLTVGDGLVSQIPALIVSIGAGLMVSKAGTAGSTQVALFNQFGRYPKALGVSAGLMAALAILPGTPFFPFMSLALIAASFAYYLPKKQAEEKAMKAAVEQAKKEKTPVEEKPIATALAIDTIRLELGYGLLPLVNSSENNRLTDQIRGLRRQMATDIGFVLPSVRIQDNLKLGANSYRIMIKEINAAEGELRPTRFLCMDPKGLDIDVPGERTKEPTFGLPAKWIEKQHREEAHFKGYTVVDAQTVLTTHLTEVVKDYMDELLSYTETQKLLDELDKSTQKLVADIVPNQMSVSGVQRVLQSLLSERVSIRDLSTILEGITEATGYTKNLTQITEHVRGRLARQISNDNMDPAGILNFLTLSPDFEQIFAQSLVGEGEEKQLALPPSQLQQFMRVVNKTYEQKAQDGLSPVMLVSPGIRPYVRSIIERFRPQTVIMSQSEIHPKARIKTVGQIALEEKNEDQ